MAKYTAVTFAPVQGFIEKSRKLRDLYGASLILSYLSQKIASYVNQQTDLELISPALPNLQKGMPNRILMRGEMSQETARDIIISAWKEVLKICREWIETEIQNSYYWEREWNLWGSHTWEIFRGVGDSIAGAMNDLETKKLSRDWSAINWIGESSSLTGTDGIAFPELGASHRNPKNLNYGWEDQEIRGFYEQNIPDLIDSVLPNWELSPDITIFRDHTSKRRNYLFHNLRGLKEQQEVFEIWKAKDYTQWQNKIIGCLNFITKQEFNSLEKASLMSSVHEELKKYIHNYDL
ncbi:type III-B CRISPR-associated protein Cas10/Cmr2 [Raphidiopsis sp. BLCC-F218]